MSGSTTMILYVLLILLGVSWVHGFTGCITITAPGTYTLTSDLTYTSSQSTACIRVSYFNVTSGSTAVIIDGNYRAITCLDTSDKECVPVLKVDSDVMVQVSFINSLISGAFSGTIIDGGASCTVKTNTISTFTTQGDVIKCNGGNNTIFNNVITTGAASGYIINAANSEGFQVSANSISIISVSQTMIYANNGTGSITLNTINEVGGTPDCMKGGFASAAYGDTYGTAAASCNEILRKRPTASTGAYYVLYGSTPLPVFCDFTMYPGRASMMVYKVNDYVALETAAARNAAYLWTQKLTQNDNTTDVLSISRNNINYVSRMLGSSRTYRKTGVRVYNHGTRLAFLDFTSGSGASSTFFKPSKVIASSWTDLPTSDSWSNGNGQMFDMNAYAGRNWYINSLWGGCPNDVGWLLVGAGTTASASDVCKAFWFSSNDANPMHIYVNKGSTRTSLSDPQNFIQADVFAIFADVEDAPCSSTCATKGGCELSSAANCACPTRTTLNDCSACTSHLISKFSCSTGVTGIHVEGAYNVDVSGNILTNLHGTDACPSSIIPGTTNAIRVVNTTGAIVRNNTISKLQGGNGESGDTIGLFVKSSDYISIQGNSIKNIASATNAGAAFETKNSGRTFGLLVEDCSQANVSNNAIASIVGGFGAESTSSVKGGDANKVAGASLKMVGGSVTNNNIESIYGGGAGLTRFSSSDTGICSSTNGIEFENSASMLVQSNKVRGIFGCAAGSAVELSESAVISGGVACGIYSHDSNLDVQLNNVSTITGGTGGSSAQMYAAYGGPGYAYCIYGQLTSYYNNYALNITNGANGTSGLGIDMISGVKVQASEVYNELDSCTTNVAAQEMCYPTGTTCCPSTCKTKPTSVVCRASAGICDVDDTCLLGVCPELKRPSGYLCRGAIGSCDIIEYCDGTSNDCPVDALQPIGTACSNCNHAGTCYNNGSCTSDQYCVENCNGYPSENCTQLLGCHNMTTPGFYFAMEDIHFSAGLCLNASSTGVVVSGNGHSLACDGLCSSAVLAAYGISFSGFNVSGNYTNSVVNVAGGCTVNQSSFSNISTLGDVIRCSNAAVVVTDVDLFDIVTAQRGVAIENAAAFTVQNNLIYQAQLQTGIYVKTSTNGIVTSNTISNISTSCCASSGIFAGIISDGTSKVQVSYNSLNAFAPVSESCQCSAYYGLVISGGSTSVVNNNELSDLRGASSTIVAGLCSLSPASNSSWYNNAISNLIGTAGSTTNPAVYGAFIQSDGLFNKNTITSVSGAGMNAYTATTSSTFGVKIQTTGASLTVDGNNVTGITGYPGANANTGDAFNGGDAIGVYSANTYIKFTNTQVSNVVSGAGGNATAGHGGKPGSVHALVVSQKMTQYSNLFLNGLTLGEAGTGSLGTVTNDASSTEVKAITLDGCFTDFTADVFCYPIGVGQCFRTCEMHYCNVSMPDPVMVSIVCNGIATVKYPVRSQHSFNYTIDGSNMLYAPAGTSEVYFNVTGGSSYTVEISDFYDCPANRTLVVPKTTPPNQMESPYILFDVTPGLMQIGWYKLLYPSETGQLQVNTFTVQYRINCSGSVSEWINTTVPESEESILVPYMYTNGYDVQIYSTNCNGSSVTSPIASFQAPFNPRLPVIVSVTPSEGLSTKGGVLTLAGDNFPSSNFTVFLDNSTVCDNATYVDPGIIKCTPPVGISSTHNVLISLNVVSCHTQESTAVRWSYERPNVTSITGLISLGGAANITGTNFGPASTKPNVTIDGVACIGCVVSEEHTEITCNNCPGGYDEGHELVVQIGDQVSTTHLFSYPVCSPVCLYGTCVANATDTHCECFPGYTGEACTKEIICTSDALAVSRCGACDSGICCFFELDS